MHGLAGVLLWLLCGEPQAPRPGAVALPPVLVTATRRPADPLTVPYLAAVLESGELTVRKQFRTVPEALREIPGVMVQKTAHGQGSPFLRGFTGFRTLFLIDGIRLNNSVFRDGPNQYWNTVDPFSLERLEVVKGPGAVAWGSDAVGGAVAAVTRSPGPYGPGWRGSRRIHYRFASAEASHVGRAEVSATYDGRLGVFLGATVKHFGDLQGGRDVGRQKKTGYREWDADLKLEYFLGEKVKLVAAHQRVDQDDIWRTHKTIYGISWEGTTVGKERQRILDQDRDLTYLQLHATDLGAAVSALRMSLSFHHQEEERNRIRKDGRMDIQGFSVNTVGFWLQAESPTALGRLTYGLDYYKDNVNSFRKDFTAAGTPKPPRIQGPVADDSNYHLLGLFLQDEVQLTDRLAAILGARYTWAKAVARDVADPQTGKEISFTERYSALVGSLRGSYRLDREGQWFAFAGVSQAFRAPNLSDLTRFDTARTNEIETPSPGLDPERFVSLEVGVKTRTDRFTGSVGYFYTFLDDLIVRTPTGRVIGGNNEVTKRNSGSGYVQGVEAEVRYRVYEGWDVLGALTWQDGRVKTFPTSAPIRKSEPLSRLMPTSGYLGARWTHRQKTAWVEGLVRFAFRQDRLSTRDKADTQRIPPGGTPGYVVVTLRGGLEVTERVTLSCAVENLTNQDYRIHGSGLNEPGTNVILGVDVTF